MKASLENLLETNTKLTSQIELDKIKQETLVAKINEVLFSVTMIDIDQ